MLWMYSLTCASSILSAYFLLSWSSILFSMMPLRIARFAAFSFGSPGGGILIPLAAANALTSCEVIGSPSTLAITWLIICARAEVGAIAADPSNSSAPAAARQNRNRAVSVCKFTASPRPVFQLFTRRQRLQDIVELRKSLRIFADLEPNHHDECGGQPNSIAIRGGQRRQPRRIDRRIGMKADLELLALHDGAHDEQLLHLAPDAHRGRQVIDQCRQRSETIAQLVAQLIEIAVAFRARHTAVQDQPLVFVRYEVLRDVGRDAEAEFGLEVGMLRFAAKLVNRLLHHLGVQLEPYRRDLTGLLAAKEIARAAMLEIAHRKLKAGTGV